MDFNQEISKFLEPHNLSVYDTETFIKNKTKIFRIFITNKNKKEGISLDLCAKISKELAPFLDVNSPIKGYYTLEVSSPGIERKLIKKKHFYDAIGENIKFKNLLKKKYKGILELVEDNFIYLKIKGKIEKFNISDIENVETYLKN